jgi:hypothetical protein
MGLHGLLQGYIFFYLQFSHEYIFVFYCNSIFFSSNNRIQNNRLNRSHHVERMVPERNPEGYWMIHQERQDPFDVGRRWNYRCTLWSGSKYPNLDVVDDDDIDAIIPNLMFRRIFRSLYLLFVYLPTVSVSQRRIGCQHSDRIRSGRLGFYSRQGQEVKCL